MTDSAVLSGKELYSQFSQRIDDLENEGLVDFKMKVFGGRDTSVDGVVLTLNNALRLRSEKKFKKAIIT